MKMLALLPLSFKNDAIYTCLKNIEKYWNQLKFYI